MRNAVWLGLLVSVSRAAPVPPRPFHESETIDLTHAFDEATIYWPTEPGFGLEVAAEGVTEGGYYYLANRFCTAEHGGTHIDAPSAGR